MRLAINPWVVFENPWHRFLTLWKIWAQNAARSPNLAPWTPDLNYRLVPRNYLSFRRVISIEKLSWATFPISAWVCDQLLAYTFVDMLSFRKFFFVIVSLAKHLLWRWHENQNGIWMFWQLCVLCFQKLLLILAWKTLQKTM